MHGDVVEIFPAYSEKIAYRVEFFGDEVDRITEIDVLTGSIIDEIGHVAIYPASHYVVAPEKIKEAAKSIEAELKERVSYFKSEDKLLEAQLISERKRQGSPYIRMRIKPFWRISRVNSLRESLSMKRMTCSVRQSEEKMRYLMMNAMNS